LVLDSAMKVVFANKWLLVRAHMSRDEITDHPLMEVFPNLLETQFEKTLSQAMRTGFPALLSQSLHPSPFPLYTQGAAQRDQDKLMRQSIHIVPMGPTDAALAGQRYTLIQITDVTPNVLRERLLKAKADKLHGMAHIDSLTGIGNRRYFDQALLAELRTATRTRSSVGLVLLDIDHFKQYNDFYGHPAGDKCLREVADVLREVCQRPRDVVARYGGEEMALILPGTNLQGTVMVADEILQKLRDLAIPHESNPGGSIVTLSAGVTASFPSPSDSGSALLRQADQALYAAKHAGRDRLFYFDPVTNTVTEH
jgi:diguanylate cyclase (GGDEF)-like protein